MRLSPPPGDSPTGDSPSGTAPPGVVLDSFLPQPGRHSGRRIIRVEDTPVDWWLDSASTAGTSWTAKLGLVRSEAGTWDISSPEQLASYWFDRRAAVVRRGPRLPGATSRLRSRAVAVNADAQQVLSTTGALRAWAQGRAGALARIQLEEVPAQDTDDGGSGGGGSGGGGSGGGGSGGSGSAGSDSGDSGAVEATGDFVADLVLIGTGTVSVPTSTWGGLPTSTPVDVEAPPEPAFFIIQVVGITSFLGDYGPGRTVKTMSLLPGEIMTMSMRTWRATEETIAAGSSIIDSYDQSASERFAETVLTESTDTATREKSENWHAEAEASGSFGLASASVSGGGGGEYSSSTEQFAKSMSEAIGEHAAEASSHRENTVTSSSESSTATEDESVVERTIKNINVGRTLNFTIRELNQAWITKTHLTDLRIAFSNGNAGAWREEPLPSLRKLVAENVRPEFVDRMCADILRTVATVRDDADTPVTILQQVRLDECGTEHTVRDAVPGDNCEYPPPREDGRMYYRFAPGPLGQAPDQEHPVPGVLLARQDIVMTTDSVVAEALLGAEDALDDYSARLQLETIREKRLASDREAIAQEIVRTGNGTAADLFVKVFGIAPPALTGDGDGT